MFALLIVNSKSSYIKIEFDKHCGNTTKVCNGICLFDDDRVESQAYICLEDSMIDLCYNPRPYFIMSVFCAIAPTVIAFILHFFILNSLKPPYIHFIGNILSSASIVIVVLAIVCGATGDIIPLNLVLIAVFLLVYYIGTGCFVCSDCSLCTDDYRQKSHFIKDAMKYPRLDLDDGTSAITMSRQNPPKFNIVGVEVRRRNDIKTRRPIKTEEVKYESWQENGEMVNLPKTGTSVVNMIIRPHKSQGFEEILNERKTTLDQFVATQSVFRHEIDEVCEVSGVIEKFIIKNDSGEFRCCHRFASTCCGGCIYGFLQALGLSAIYDIIWCYGTEHVEVLIEKNLSEKSDLRSKPDQKDMEANTYVCDVPIP